MTKIILDNPKLEQDIPIGILHPDPVQPRTAPDSDLSESIKTQGILQAITTEPITAGSIPDTTCEDCGRAFVELAAEGGHFLILDGERRFRGTIAAGRKTILGKVVPPSTEGSRLLRQLTSNTGKPLTPIEEAFAFQRLMEAQGWSQAELARHLGRPRSVVGDRIRLVNLDAAWLNLISSGDLQVSHAAQLHLYEGVPAKYQAEAAKMIVQEWLDNREDPITVEDFDFALRDAFRPILTPIGEVSPQYKGPTVEVTLDYNGKRKFAADPEIWKPIAAEKAKRAKAEQKKSGSSSHPSGNSYESEMSKTIKRLKAAGIALPERKTVGYSPEVKKGETVIFTDGGWTDGLHPKVLLEKLDSSTLVAVKSQYGSARLVTSDAAAVAASQEAYQVHAAEATRKELAPLRDQLTPARLTEFAVVGPGAIPLLKAIGTERGAPKVVALALGLKIAGGIIDEVDEVSTLLPDGSSVSDAEKLLSGLAAVSALSLKVPDDWQMRQRISSGLGKIPFKIEKPKTIAATTEPKSKKQSKRDARAAGEQVGDPMRAKDVDVGEIRAAIEAGTALDEESILESEGLLDEEEEFVEA